MSDTIELYRTLKTFLCRSYFWIKLFFLLKKGMTCGNFFIHAGFVNPLADALLFVVCTSALLYVYINISVDNIIFTNNKMIQLFGSSTFLPKYFLSRILVHFCIFLERKLLVTHWDFCTHKPSTSQNCTFRKRQICNSRLIADMLSWAYRSLGRSCTLSLVQPYS